MRLYRLTVVEEYVVGRDEEDAILEAFDGVTDVEFAGYIDAQEIPEPTATLYFTEDQMMMLGRAITTVAVPLTGKNYWLDQIREIRSKIDQGITQIAVQTVMVEREEG